MDIVMLQEVSGQLDHYAEDQTMAMQIQVEDPSGNVAPEVVITSTSPKTKTFQSATNKAPLSPADTPVLVRGNLHKLGKRLKGWHQRYFEIQGSHMYYYKNTTKRDFLGEINLDICYYCEPSAAATFGQPFELRTALRSHTLAARTQEEMYQWVQVIKANMCRSKEEASKIDTTKLPSSKPKRWESFKNPFATRTRQHGHGAPPSRKKSFADRFKIKRSRSPTPEAEMPHSKRPLSLTGDEVPQNTLAVLAEIEVSQSLPATPLTKKRTTTMEPPASPLSFSSEDPPYSPALTLDSSQHSTPSHVSEQNESGMASEQLQEKEPIKKNKPDAKEVMKEEFVLPNILTKKFVWEEIRETLESNDQTEDESYSELPPEEKPWLDKPTGMEQLRAFLYVCP